MKHFVLHTSEPCTEKYVTLLASVMTPCSLEGGYQCVREICCPTLQQRSAYETESSILIQNICEQLCGVTTMKTRI